MGRTSISSATHTHTPIWTLTGQGRCLVCDSAATTCFITSLFKEYVTDVSDVKCRNWKSASLITNNEHTTVTALNTTITGKVKKKDITVFLRLLFCCYCRQVWRKGGGGLIRQQRLDFFLAALTWRAFGGIIQQCRTGPAPDCLQGAHHPIDRLENIHTNSYSVWLVWRFLNNDT